MNKRPAPLIKAILALLIFIIFYACGPDLKQTIMKNPARHFRNYSFNSESSLKSRVCPASEIVLSHLRKMDNMDDYKAYIPEKNEMSIIGNSFDNLPPLTRSLLRERLLGIYFITNLLGSGLTDWVVDKDNNIYMFMVFNPEVLKKNFSELITSKEKTCFKNDDSSIELSFDCGKRYNGFLYILLHESTHAVDYVMDITPYTEKIIQRFQANTKNETEFTSGIWMEYSRTYLKYPFRDDVTFYGFGNGPKMKISEAVDIYTQLSMSPFPSLYGSTNWAEDLAEFVTFYHYTEKMKQKFVINLYRDGKIIYTAEPMKNPEVRKRFRAVQVFY